jgi:oligopeptide/dipeptide ABC transporter ATP-binding protein
VSIGADVLAGQPLTIENLSVTFATDSGPLTAVDQVSLTLAPGRTLGLVGESGCGKSMTALSILGLVPPPGRITGGRIGFDGDDLTQLSETALDLVRGRHIAMIFQEPMTALNPVYSVGEQIAEVLVAHQGLGRKDAHEAAIAMLEKVRMPEPAARARAYPHQLSGGMRQRAMIAMALACSPDIVIADEPTTALDVTIQAQILDLMLEMQASLGMAMLFISHNLGVVSEVADDVAVMYAGRIVEQAPADALFAAPLHPYTRGLIETLPKADGQRARLPSIPGTVPDLRALPPGCRFSDRCPIADAACRSEDPPLRALPGGRAVACIKAQA